MGPTIKPGSNIEHYLPSLVADRNSQLRQMGASNDEPLLRTASKALAEGDAREIDGIHFWSATADQADAIEKAQRRLSLS